MKLIKLLSLITALCLVFTLAGCSSGGSSTDTTGGPTYEKGTLCSKDAPLTVTDGNLTLDLDPKTCNITVTEKASGRVWSSNPSSDYEDEFAAGTNRTAIFAQLMVSYVGKSTAVVTTNSYASSIRKDTYNIYSIDGGFRVEYTFNEGFTVPVAYTVKDGSFYASILYSGITEDEFKISTISLLPYFGTAGAQDDGFLFIPDGSGAVINFNNGKLSATAYEKKVYGKDETLPNDIESSREEQIYIPVVGMKKNDGAFIARATSAEGESTVNASIYGVGSGFNTVYFEATYREAQNISVMNGSLGTAGLVLYAAKNPSANDTFTVEYTFLEGSNHTVGDMATTLRDLLVKEGSIVKATDEASLYVDLYGGINKQKSFIGFQYTGVEPLTTFRQAQTLLDRLIAEDCGNITVGYKQYSGSFFGGKTETDFAPDSAIGSKKDLKNLMSFAQEKGIDLYLFADYYSITSTGNGFSRFFSITKELDLGAASVQPKKINTNLGNPTATPYYMLKPTSYKQAADKIIASADKYDVSGIYLGKASGILPGDYDNGGAQRGVGAELAAAAAETLSAKKLMLSSPNFYMWKYMDKATDLPVSSSQHHLFDYDVPFLQMLLKGNVSISGYELNIKNSGDDLWLRHIAAGQSIHYGFMSDHPSDLLTTDYVSLYGLSDSQIDTAVAKAKQFAEFHTYIKDLTIADYSVSGDLSTTTYSNGTKVLVNYGDAEATAEGATVSARGFTVVKDGKSVFQGGESK